MEVRHSPVQNSLDVPQYVANYIANGEIDTEFIPVESEHSSMSAAVGASAAGARTLTATSSCGLALMWEELYVAGTKPLSHYQDYSPGIYHSLALSPLCLHIIV